MGGGLGGPWNSINFLGFLKKLESEGSLISNLKKIRMGGYEYYLN